jgi:hypothetical protein
VLLEFGFSASDEVRRVRAAVGLADDGVTVDALETACEFLARQSGYDPKTTGARIAEMLKNGTWRAVLSSAEAQQKRDAEAAAKAEASSEPRRDYGERERAEQDRLRKAQDRTAMAAYAMLAFDGKAPAAVVLELGVSLAQMPVLVRQGAATYGVDADEAAKLLTGSKAKGSPKR